MNRSLLRKTIETTCTVEIENTAQRLVTNVVLDGDFDMEPGDTVIVHDAPTAAHFGERIVVRRNATVSRAGRAARFWTRASSLFTLTELYEVSFTDGSAS